MTDKILKPVFTKVGIEAKFQAKSEENAKIEWFIGK